MIKTFIANTNIECDKLDQVEQYISNLYSFVLKDNAKDIVTNAHHFVKCRDFLNDIFFYSTYIKKDIKSIYGLNYSIKDQEIDWKNPQLLLKFTNQEHLDLFIKNINYLYSFETFYEIAFTVVEETTDKQIILLTFSSFWLKNTITLSLYTYILRCLCYPIKGNFWKFILNFRVKKLSWDNTPYQILNPEGYLIYEIEKKKLFFLIQNLPEIDLNFKDLDYHIKNDNAYIIHDSLGFVCQTTYHIDETNYPNIKKNNNKLCPADVKVVM